MPRLGGGGCVVEGRSGADEVDVAVAGGLLIAAGLTMLVWTVVLFDRVGEGTLAIGSPVKLVVRGPYRHVRNPMMTSVFGIQLGTAIAFASPWLFGWFAWSPLSAAFAHAHLAAIGWAVMMVVGLSYRLIPMIVPAELYPVKIECDSILIGID